MIPTSVSQTDYAAFPWYKRCGFAMNTHTYTHTWLVCWRTEGGREGEGKNKTHTVSEMF